MDEVAGNDDTGKEGIRAGDVGESGQQDRPHIYICA